MLRAFAYFASVAVLAAACLAAAWAQDPALPADRTVNRRVFRQAEDHFEWGRQLLAAGDVRLAEAELLLAVRINPMESRAWRELGLVSLAFGDTDKAIERLDKSLTVDPSDTKAYLGKARALWTAGTPEKAEEQIAKALLVEPGDPEIWILMGDLLAALGRMIEGHDAYMRSAALDAVPVNALRKAGALAFRLGALRFSQADFETIETLSGIDPSAAQYLARIYAARAGSDFPADLVSAMDTDPLDPEPYSALGERALSRGDLQASAVYFLLALRYDPLDSGAMVNLGYVAFERGDPASARDWFERALEREGDDVDILYNLGLACLKLNNFTLAATHLQRALSLDPQRPELYRVLAKTYHGMGMDERATAFLSEYVRLAPEANDAAEFRKLLGEAKDATRGATP